MSRALDSASPYGLTSTMSAQLGALKKLLFGISSDEASFARRGFQTVHAPLQERLESIGRTFVKGYRTALQEGDPNALGAKLNEIELEFRGFAFEGAAMGCALLDYLTPWKSQRLQRLIEGPGENYIHLIHVGAGWAMARLPWRISHRLAHMDPLLGWLAIDGFGFHQGYFRWPIYIEKQRAPNLPVGYPHRVFDQGLGRSLWFVKGADVDRITSTINGFSTERQPDLWSGIGLAAAYAGGVDRSELERLRDRVGMFLPELAQGAAFAAKARQRADNIMPYTEQACQVFCNTSANAAAVLTDAALLNLNAHASESAYELWRVRIQENFREH